MAGYIFSVSRKGWQAFCEKDLKHGYFTPYVPVVDTRHTERQRKAKNKVLSATLGDIVTMKPNDNIYFLSNRKIYGIGVAKLIGEDCKYDNYTDASALLPDSPAAHRTYLTTNATRARWVCFFEPSPYFFKKGVDMDDVLRYRPNAFRSLRAFEGVSFIKIDDEENRALKEYISLVNEDSYRDIHHSTFSFEDTVHTALSMRRDLSSFKIDAEKALSYPGNRDYVISEMFIECALLQALAENKVRALGSWDYATHQLIASPFKPLAYIDKIDIFGYKFSQRYQGEPRLITKYLIVELKKDVINRKALEQTMQYVDWVCQEYASGDYSKIEAYVVGSHAVHNLNYLFSDICQRSFIAETHPATPQKWSDLHVISYSISNSIEFDEIPR